MPDNPPPPEQAASDANASGGPSADGVRNDHPPSDRAQRLADASARAARSSAKAARTSAKAAQSVAKGTSNLTKKGAGRVHKAAGAQGASRTGLARLIELNGISAFSDALVAISLAGTLFFAVPTEAARSNVAQYLLLTMLPFVIVAPLVGPFLDRYRHGRRWAIGLTVASRGFLAWVAADAVLDESSWLFPAALGILVGQKSYAVTRAAAVPRVLPEEIKLVTANSRLQLAATIGTLAGAGVGGAVSLIGTDWPLRIAFFTYVAATVLAITLPSNVDSSADEQPASLRDHSGRQGRRWRVGGNVVAALRANCALRGFSGFLTFFLAFMLRNEDSNGIGVDIDGFVLLGIAAGAAWLGSSGGTLVGSFLKARNPDRTVRVLLTAAATVALVATVWWDLITVIIVALMAGFGQQLGRLSLDAVIQRDVPEYVQSNAFARSETLLQLSWVVGGGLGITLPLNPHLGMGVALAALLAGLFATTRVRADPAGH